MNNFEWLMLAILVNSNASSTWTGIGLKHASLTTLRNIETLKRPAELTNKFHDI